MKLIHDLEDARSSGYTAALAEVMNREDFQALCEIAYSANEVSSLPEEGLRNLKRISEEILDDDFQEFVLDLPDSLRLGAWVVRHILQECAR